MTERDGERRILKLPYARIWRFPPQDGAGPDFPRDLLPFDNIGQMDFGRELALFFPARKSSLTETLFGDGRQAGPRLSVKPFADVAKKSGQAANGLRGRHPFEDRRCRFANLRKGA